MTPYSNGADWPEYEPAVQVYCPEDQIWIDETTVETLNIEEDIQGRDVLTFKCPGCHQEHRSLRRG